jgi:hypothetical protein
MSHEPPATTHTKLPRRSWSSLSPDGREICLLPVTAAITGGDAVATTPKDLADLLDVSAQASCRLTSEVDRLLGSRAAVSCTMVERLLRLADDLRPGAAARAELSVLADLDTDVLLAGMSEWLLRRRSPGTTATSAWSLKRHGGLIA